MYNSSYDTLPNYDQIQRIQSYNKEGIVTELHKVFSYFGDPRVHTEEIQNHADKIIQVVDKLNSKDGLSTAEEMLSLSLMTRTLAILTLSSTYQADKAKILQPITMYLDIVAQYLKDKRIDLNVSTGDALCTT